MIELLMQKYGKKSVIGLQIMENSRKCTIVLYQ